MQKKVDTNISKWYNLLSAEQKGTKVINQLKLKLSKKSKKSVDKVVKNWYITCAFTKSECQKNNKN